MRTGVVMKTEILNYLKAQLNTEKKVLKYCHSSQKQLAKDRVTQLKKHITNIEKLC